MIELREAKVFHREVNSAGPLRILLAQRACAERYPPVLHQATLLSRLGSVSVLDAPGRHDDRRIQTAPSIERIRIYATTGIRARARENANWAFRYAREFQRQMALHPDIVVAYEPAAAALLLARSAWGSSEMRIVHLHEIPDKALYSESVISKLAVRIMLARLHAADLVLVPDPHRAGYTANAAKLQRVPTAVMNCPPILEHLPASKLLPWLSQRGVSTNRIVHFQGSLGHDRALARVIMSMRHWPCDAVFVLVGDGPLAVQQELHALAERESVASRVLFVGRVPYDNVLPFAVGASLGVTLLEPINSNLEFCAGASNKRFEYAALGIPQVTNTGAGMDALFESPGVATLVDVADTQMIGQAIARLLLDPLFAVTMGDRARRLHLCQYNYEYQFGPVLERIRERILDVSHNPK